MRVGPYETQESGNLTRKEGVVDYMQFVQFLHYANARGELWTVSDAYIKTDAFVSILPDELAAFRQLEAVVRKSCVNQAFLKDLISSLAALDNARNQNASV